MDFFLNSLKLISILTLSTKKIFEKRLIDTGNRAFKKEVIVLKKDWSDTGAPMICLVCLCLDLISIEIFTYQYYYLE